MNFEWTIENIYEDLPEKEYMNQCCVGGDEVLEKIKTEIADGMDIEVSEIDIYQEDWGWALEFFKDRVTYFLGVSNTEAEIDDKILYTADTQATRQEKGLFFNKTIDAVDEAESFSELVSRIAKQKGFEEN